MKIARMYRSPYGFRRSASTCSILPGIPPIAELLRFGHARRIQTVPFRTPEYGDSETCRCRECTAPRHRQTRRRNYYNVERATIRSPGCTSYRPADPIAHISAKYVFTEISILGSDLLG